MPFHPVGIPFKKIDIASTCYVRVFSNNTTDRAYGREFSRYIGRGPEIQEVVC